MQTIDYGNYLVNSDGQIYSKQRNKFMKPIKHNQGYFGMNLDGRKVLIHRLVATLFIDNPENKPCVNHIDGDKHNNAVTNLEWVTYSENHLHAFRTGLRENPTGFQLQVNKLSEDAVKYIRANYKQGDKEYGICPLARQFGVSPPVIRKVILGKSYKSVV